MANSSTVSAGDDILASQYNDLREDVLDNSTGHNHEGTDGKILDEDALSFQVMKIKASGTFTDTVAISSLDGNTDIVYKLIIYGQSTNTPDMDLRFNTDSGSNYHYSRTNLSSGSTTYSASSSASATGINIAVAISDCFMCTLFIMLKSGKTRGLTFQTVDGTSQYHFGGGAWTNTADNITVINIILSSVITSGYYYLYANTQM